jgi:hypothetical protein
MFLLVVNDISCAQDLDDKVKFTKQLYDFKGHMLKDETPSGNIVLF